MIDFKQSGGCELDADELSGLTANVEYVRVGFQVEREDAISLVLGVSLVL